MKKFLVAGVLAAVFGSQSAVACKMSALSADSKQIAAVMEHVIGKLPSSEQYDLEIIKVRHDNEGTRIQFQDSKGKKSWSDMFQAEFNSDCTIEVKAVAKP